MFLTLIFSLLGGGDRDEGESSAFTKEDFEPYISLLDENESAVKANLGEEFQESIDEYDPNLKELHYYQGSAIDPTGEIVVILENTNGEFLVTSIGFTLGTTYVFGVESHLTELFGEPSDIERDTESHNIDGYWKEDGISYHLITDNRFENRKMSLYIAYDVGQYVRWQE